MKMLGAMKELTKDNVQEIKFLLKGRVGEGRLEMIKTSLDLFEELEKLRWITEDSLETLYQLLRGINRGDIISKLQNGNPELTCRNVPVNVPVVTPDQPIANKVLDEVANNITTDWKRLSRFLDIPEAKIDMIDEDYRRVYEKSLQCLKVWTQTAQSLGNGMSWKILKEALAGLPRYDIIRLIETNFPEVNKVVQPPRSPATHPGYIQASSITDERAACVIVDSTSNALSHLHIEENGSSDQSAVFRKRDTLLSFNSTDSEFETSDMFQSTPDRLRQDGSDSFNESNTCIAESGTPTLSTETVLTNEVNK